MSPQPNTPITPSGSLAALVDVGLAHRVAKRLRRHAELAGDLRDRATRRAHQLDGHTPELRRKDET